MQTRQPPDPVLPPLAYVGAALGLALLLLLAVAALTRSQVRALRPSLAGVIALGLSPKWAR